MDAALTFGSNLMTATSGASDFQVNIMVQAAGPIDRVRNTSGTSCSGPNAA